jgi:radical SAM/Cys-rich protein
VEVVCSLPHYRAQNTDKQRGEGVYDNSIRALKRLNALGYGDGKSALRLVLVTNPVGAFLPAGQASLETEWKRELLKNHGIRFDALFTITNMPISRFLEWLEQSGNLAVYLERLVTAFNPAAAQGVMCRNTLSVGWDGQLYDCDFNQMLDLPVEAGAPRHIRDFDRAKLEARAIVTDRHCFGCTAGAGSSCGGATT